MNWLMFLKDMNFKQLNDVAENWYARLNRLKQLDYKNERVSYLIKIMQERMIAITQIYISINQPSIPKFKKGSP